MPILKVFQTIIFVLIDREMWIKVYTHGDDANIKFQFIYPVNKVRLFRSLLIYNLNQIDTNECLMIVISSSF